MSDRWIAGFVLASLLAAGVVFAQQPAGGGAGEAVAPVTTPNANFKTLKGQSSYAIGVDIARGLQQQGMDVDPALVSRGIADTLAGGKLLLTDKELQATMLQVQKDAVTRAQQNFVKLADKNKKEGAAFLAQNKNREGVKTTASGLQYKVLKQGNGATPRATDVVTVNYRGTFLDGTEFDSSYARNEPAKFPCNRVIAGWVEALQLMHVGDKWQIFVPSNLAYAEAGMGNDIPPNATLVFEIELLDTKPAASAKPAGQGADSLPRPQ
ncbi:MAG TPA: FKBP-type peptidyl-prolyl cis-trans isomerase [Pirellulales bacterium]